MKWKKIKMKIHFSKKWASSGIEPESNAPEALMIPLHQEAFI